MTAKSEALRPIARYKIGYHTDEWGMRSSTPSGIPDPAGAWVRYEDHIAALQAQQPAPSAAAAGSIYRNSVTGAFELIDYAGEGHPPGTHVDIYTAPQPSPTPQADSQPAPQGETNAQLDIDSNSSAPGQQRDVAGSVALGQPVGNGSDQAAGHTGAQGDKLLIVAERNIRSFLRSAVFKSESDREAALNCVDVLWEAARAPADSVTAPAGGAVAGPLDSLALMKVVMQADEALSGRCTRGTTNWAAAIGKAVQRAVVAAAPQPAPPADSVLEDAARWQALGSCVLEINGGKDWMSIVLKDDAKPEPFLKGMLADKLAALAARLTSCPPHQPE